MRQGAMSPSEARCRLHRPKLSSPCPRHVLQHLRNCSPGQPKPISNAKCRSAPDKACTMAQMRRYAPFYGVDTINARRLIPTRDALGVETIASTPTDTCDCSGTARLLPRYAGSGGDAAHHRLDGVLIPLDAEVQRHVRPRAPISGAKVQPDKSAAPRHYDPIFAGTTQS